MVFLMGVGASGISCGTEDGRTKVRGDRSGTGTGSNGNGNGNGNGTGGGTGIPTDGIPQSNGGCNEFTVNFEQQIPNVVLLVDASGSMWNFKVQGSNTSFWDALKPALLNVVSAFEDEVKFSFTAYTSPPSTGPARGETCPQYVESAPPRLTNGSSIRSAYDSVVNVPESETPTIYALEDAMAALNALGPDAGPKHILLVTDGQPDYCESEREACAVYETVGILQKAYNQGIGTIVVGLVGPDNQTLAPNLQHFANAGAGVPVNASNLEQEGNNPYHCWDAIYGRTEPMHPATFGVPVENAPVHMPEQDTSSLETALSGVIKGVKSCSYQLEDQVTIDPTTAHTGKIYLQKGDDEVEVSFESGWALDGDSTVQLLGDSCEALKAVDTTGIRFDFPCEVFIIR